MTPKLMLNTLFLTPRSVLIVKPYSDWFFDV
jgi:hypothetical protein